jgi:hypothetical protein
MMIYSLLLLNHASWHYPALIIHFWGNFLPIQFSGGKDAAAAASAAALLKRQAK